MGYKTRIAFRYLLSPKSHSAVNVISAVSVGGVAVAVAAIVCVLSVFNGFNNLLSDTSAAAIPDILVSPATGKTLPCDSVTIATIKNISGVENVCPIVEERALAIGDNGIQIPVRVIGAGDNFSAVSPIPESIIDGIYGLHDENDTPLATLSVGTAINIGLRPDPATRMTLVMPRRQGRINPANPAASFRTDTLTVGGVFQTDQSDYDSDVVIVPLSSTRRLLQYSDSIASAIYISISKTSDRNKTTEVLKNLLPYASVKDRLAQQETSYRMIAIEKWITFAMMAFILFIASFNIISTLSMLIIEKSSTIYVLQSLGASGSDVTGVFSRAGWLICLTGIITGLAIGTVLCLLQQHFGIIRLNGDSNSLVTDTYPVALHLTDLLAIASAGTAIGLLTSAFTSPFARRYLNRNTSRQPS